MTTAVPRETAKIYRFPTGGRAGLSVRRVGGAPIAVIEPKRVANVASAAGWYHDDAIAAAELEWKR
ncbi:MAG: DUF2735 domain-containing protein [Hyphomicrobium sp.]